MTETTARVRARWPAWIAWLPGLAVLGGLVWLVATHLSEERELASLLTRARPPWLLAAALLQAATYLSVGETWRLPLRAAGHPFSRWRLARLALIKLTLDQAVPTGGMSGAVFMSQRLKRLGVPGAALGATMLIVVVGYYLAYAVAVAPGASPFCGSTRQLERGRHRARHRLCSASPPAFRSSCCGACGAATAKCRSGCGGCAGSAACSARPRSPRPISSSRKRLFLGSATGSFVTMLLDSLTLAVTLLAVGARPNVLTCFAALVLRVGGDHGRLHAGRARNLRGRRRWRC